MTINKQTNKQPYTKTDDMGFHFKFRYANLFSFWNINCFFYIRVVFAIINSLKNIDKMKQKNYIYRFFDKNANQIDFWMVYFSVNFLKIVRFLNQFRIALILQITTNKTAHA